MKEIVNPGFRNIILLSMTITLLQPAFCSRLGKVWKVDLYSSTGMEAY